MRSKFWYVALNEYRKHVFQKSFLLAIFSVPLLIGVIFLSIFAAALIFYNPAPIGYVDQAGVLADPIEVPQELDNPIQVDFIPFQDQQAANQALETGEIQAYYLIPPDYDQTREVFVYFYEKPGTNAEVDFNNFLHVNVAADLPEDTRLMLLEGLKVSVRSLDGTREFSQKQILNFILPLGFGFLLTFVLSSGSGYLGNAVSEEKENRTIEVLSTSMSANQFILGKILGIVMVIFTQVASWLGFILIAFFGIRSATEDDWIQQFELDQNLLLILILIFILGFFFFAGIALTVSSTVTESSEAQQVIAIVSMPVSFSYLLALLVISNPDSALSVALSLIPFTSVVIMPLRLAFGTVPPEQVATCLGILAVVAALAIWLSARAFELGMMQYGKRIRLVELLRWPAGEGQQK